MRKRRKSLIIGIILFILALGIGYAYLTTTLSINGVTEVDSNTWNVYWDNVVVTTGSVEAEEPVIDTNKTTVTFSIHLKQPGDYYEFTVDAVNDGTIDAMIDEISSTINGVPINTLPSYLVYYVKYYDDTEILSKQLLSSGKKHTYRVRVEYNSNISPSDLPNNNQSLNIAFQITYIQADSSAVHRDYYLYSIEHDDSSEYTIFYFNHPFPNTPGTPIYHSVEDAANAAYFHNFTKLHVVDGIITEGWIGFMLNDTIYLMKGGTDEDLILENREILKQAYGEELCSLSDNLYQCFKSGARSLKSGIYDTGDSHTGYWGHYCNYHSNANAISC